MSIENINVGTAANDGTGDPLREAFQKVNANSAWLTGKVGTDDQAIVLGGNIGKRFLNLVASNEVWEDIRFPVETLNPAGIGTAGVLVTNSGQSGTDMALSLTTNNTLYIIAELPRTWLPGTIIHPHIHVQPQLNILNTILWDGWYSVADEGGLFPVATQMTQFGTDIPVGSQWKNLTLSLPSGGIDLVGTAGLSTTIRFKYQVAASSNPFLLLSFDIDFRYGGSPIPYTPI